MVSFDRAVALVRRFEGGAVDDPDDPGGATNYGITHRTLARWRGQRVSRADVRRLSWSEAREIYRDLYWLKARCDCMSAPVALATFDAAVNQGPGNAARFLQRALNRLGASLKVDGVTGPKTLAVLAEADHEAVVEWMTAYRGRHYSALPHVWKFGLGWFRRLAAVTWHAASNHDPNQTLNDG